MRNYLLVSFLMLIPTQLWGQENVEMEFGKQAVETSSSLRGLCVVSSNVVWTTGSRGTILRTTDGKTWETIALPGREEVEIRDVHAWDADHAIIMIAGQPAEFWETENGGQQWQRVFVDPREKSFYDDLLIDSQSGWGIAFGDVVHQAIPLVVRQPAGTWQIAEDLADLSGHPQLHGYAASGTSMVRTDQGRILLGTGGASAEHAPATVLVSEPNNWRRWQAVECPLPASESAGIFSLALHGDQVVAVGGDYLKPKVREGTAAYSQDGGLTWVAADSLPAGYRSGVAVLARPAGNVFVAVGTSGTDVSTDGGKNWQSINQLNLNAIRFADGGEVGWAVGSGCVYRIEVQGN